MRRKADRYRQLLGVLLALTGVLLVFLCLPVELFLIVLGIGMTAVWLLILSH